MVPQNNSPMIPAWSLPVSPIGLKSRSSSKKNVATKKSVSFSEQVKCRRTLHLNNYSEQEFSSAFMTSDDLERIRRDLVETVSLIERGAEIDEEETSRVGLEFYTRASLVRRKQTRFAAIDAVLEIQEIQRSEREVGGAGVRTNKHGTYHEEEAIAKVYREMSRNSAVAALLVARSVVVSSKAEESKDEEMNGTQSSTDTTNHDTNGPTPKNKHASHPEKSSRIFQKTSRAA